MIRFIILTIAAILISINLHAHQDRVLTLNEEGIISGLPYSYGEAMYDFELQILRIGENKVQIPDCFTSYLGELENYNLIFLSSWYHDTNILPKYITIKFLSNETSYEYSIMFELDNLELMNISKTRFNQSAQSSIQYISEDDKDLINCVNKTKTSSSEQTLPNTAIKNKAPKE